MKNGLYIILFLMVGFTFAQSREDYFVSSANLFINSKNKAALEKVQEGLTKFPDDKKLQVLKKKLEEQEKKNEQKKENQKEQNKGDKGKSQKENQNNNPQNGEQGGKNNGEEGGGSSENDVRKEEGNTNETKATGDLQKEIYSGILKQIENEEKNTKRRMLMEQTKKGFTQKEKDW